MLTGKRFAAIVGSVILGIVGIFSIGSLFESVDAGEIVVIQDPFDGELHVYTEPGYKLQMFGTVTRYPRRAEYAFSSPKEDGDTDTSKRLRFNDGGHANLSGAVSWEMPLSEKDIIKIHRAFRGVDGVQQQAVAKMIDSAVYLAGPLMSSTESSGERRAELVQYINDQAENGVYVTKPEEVRTVDPITNVEKTVLVTKIVRDDKGNPKRQQGSILAEYNIRLLPLAISELKYDNVVEQQIAQRQKATTDVQIAQANARKAEQDAITIAKQGEATAAKTKWEQEAINAKEIAEAEKKVKVAELAAKEAELYKREQILRGEGDAERKRLVMAADGALDPKLNAWIEVNKAYAASIAQYQGNWVPTTVLGSAAGTSGINGANNLIELLTAKTAKDLSLDLSVTGNTAKR